MSDDTWFALMHTVGPALGDGESVFAHPLFREHIAFLGRLERRGLLVAAGSFSDAPGAGMTIVRVRTEHGDVDVEALATTDDLSVVEGLFIAAVRPWNVVTNAI